MFQVLEIADGKECAMKVKSVCFVGHFNMCFKNPKHFSIFLTRFINVGENMETVFFTYS